MKRFLLLLALGLTMTLGAQTDPVPANTDGWLHYDGDEPLGGYGFANKWAIVLPAHSFAGKLTKVKIYTRESNYYPSALTMTIVEGGDTPDQGTQRHSQEVPLKSEKGWKQMIILSPLTFDENNNVWIVFECPGTLSNGIAASRNTPAEGVSGTGSYRYHESSQSWIVLSEGHYQIRAYFETWEFPEEIIYSWDFEEDGLGWHPEDLENSKWELSEGDFDRSIGAHRGVRNLKCVHRTGEEGELDRLLSFPFDFSDCKDVKLGFWRLQRKWLGYIDTLRVYQREWPYGDWILLKTYSEDTGEKWELEEGIELLSLSSTGQICFEFKSDNAYGVGLDDIYLSGTCPPEPDDSEPDGDKLTVHDGEKTDDRVPYYGFYMDSYTRSQYVLPAADLTSLRDMNIHALRWYSSNSMDEFPVGYGKARFDIYLKEVGYTAISEFEVKGDDDIVYQGAIVPSRTSDDKVLVTILFDKPFTYHGGNLLIGCENPVTGKYRKTSFWGEEVANAAVESYSYNSPALIGNEIVINFIPKTTFYYTDPSTGIEEVSGERLEVSGSRKILHDGHLYILRDGKIYNAQGAQIR